MKKLLFILFINFLLSANVYSKDYKVGDLIENNVELDKILKIGLSPGKWTVVEEDDWSYYAFSGKYIFIFKEIDNEISEYYSLGYLDTSGKRISDVNSYFYEMIYKNKYDGCYKRPEYYILELYSKGSTTNCLIIRHIDPNKELYNPDDKTRSWVDAPLRRWLEDNSLIVPDVMLRSEHTFFARTSSQKLYSIVYGINPKFFNGPKNNFLSEDTSEYHSLNIIKYKKHKKFMNRFTEQASQIHLEIENRMKLKKYQKLELAKYNPQSSITNINIKSKKEIKKKSSSSAISNEDVKKLKDLKKLLDDGVLTQEEFNSEKKKILN